MKFSDFTQENSAMLLIDHQIGTMKLAFLDPVNK